MDRKILNAISNQLQSRSQTIAVAESVTAGMVTAALSRAVDATRFLHGGLTAYNLGQKTLQLRVDPIIAEGCNCVSQQVAQQMAKEVSARFCADWGIAITGYAVPVPALRIKSCFALYAMVLQGTVIESGRIDSKLKRQGRVQEEFSNALIHRFLNLLRRM